ncbi:class I SAM-dependent methyltransferase [Cellulomonas sp. ICMP 17802]|uniref:class I SAM-dependent methyltransferase n=1 Tax=Cellulomonas sp. ICMP 17802 TaxID=3239199 RepID=UPI00351AF872
MTTALHHARESMLGLVHHPAQYGRFAGHLASGLYRRVARDVGALGLPAGARVLDVGTGPGALPLLIAQDRPDLVIDAIDLAPEMIAQAQASSTGSVTFAVADVARLPWPDATFDLVVSTISQHHWVDPTAGMAEVRRVLRPGGRAWIYDFRWALSRAQRAAEPLDAGTSVARQSPLDGSAWFSPIGRLVLRPA